MLKKILGLLSDAATYGSSAVFRQLISFFLLPLYTRYLSTSDYGIIAMLGILTALFLPLANLGITNAIFRRFNLCKEAGERQQILSTGFISLILSSLALLLVGQLWAKGLTALLIDDPKLINLVRITLLTSALTSIGQAPIVILRADRRVRLAAILNVISLLMAVSTTIWLVVFMKLGVLGVVLGNFTGELIATTVAYVSTRHLYKFKFDSTIWKSMLGYGLPFLPHRVQAVGLAMFGQYMVWNILGGQQAGIYNVALKFAMPVQFVVSSIQNAWVPYKFQIHAEDMDSASFFRSTVVYYCAGISYLWVGVSLWGRELVKLMTTAGFHSAASLISVLALVYVCQGLYFMLGTGFEFTQNTKPAPLISLAGLVVLVSLSYLLIPIYGAYGAAIATVAAWACMTLVVYKLARSRFFIPHDWISLLTMGIAAAVFVYIGGLYSEASLFSRIAISTLLSLSYPFVIFIILMSISKERGRMLIIKNTIINAIKTGQFNLGVLFKLTRGN